MEFGKSNKSKVEEQAAQVPTIPTVPIIPTVPTVPTMIPRPVPIWTPEMANQFVSHSNGIPAGFDFSAFPEISNWPIHRYEPAPFSHLATANGVQISFDGFPSSSNGISQLLTQSEVPLAPLAPSAYSAATNEDLLSQFIPPYNSQFIPNYSSFGHHQFLGVEQPFPNTIRNQYEDLPGKSSHIFSHSIKIFI